MGTICSAISEHEDDKRIEREARLAETAQALTDIITKHLETLSPAERKRSIEAGEEVLRRYKL